MSKIIELADAYAAACSEFAKRIFTYSEGSLSPIAAEAGDIRAELAAEIEKLYKQTTEPSEPVAEVAGDYNTKHIIFLPAGIALEVGDKLFTHPAPSKPAPLPELTDDEITALLPYSWPWGIEFARSILAAARAKMK